MPTRVILALFLAVSLVFTAQAQTTAPANPSPVAAEDTKAVEVPAAADKKPKYVYDPSGRRDPFQSLLEIRKPVARTEPETPLQQFDLGQLRLIGAIVGMDNPRAMVLAPDGKTYIVRVGTRIGKNNGAVVSIEQNRIVVEERFYDFTDEVRTSRQAIELPKREGV
ncbi:type IV pilus assembly protein PilP [Geoalkalibacter ferrihydriticus]|uniref:Type IV pilus assembly protein PilP n=1 Tax=Geoalkalibacter ferrihydriticus TaxID=392333 RepID=A0A1G9K710_9BACT|nr:pilus assembly protein PilP [Geoalkalibacter ferrihydriticus]SDL45326.1 type IV pilus assembly protein PilP [Geoalkalibacter ferrihydriticus]